MYGIKRARATHKKILRVIRGLLPEIVHSGAFSYYFGLSFVGEKH